MARQANGSKKQTFRIAAPHAERVLLAGDFTKWERSAVPMQKGKDGIWTANLELTPGPHNYRFIIDGQWSDDPECTTRVPNPYGTQDMVRQVA